MDTGVVSGELWRRGAVMQGQFSRPRHDGGVTVLYSGCKVEPIASRIIILRVRRRGALTHMLACLILSETKSSGLCYPHSPSLTLRNLRATRAIPGIHDDERMTFTRRRQIRISSPVSLTSYSV